jgi:dUTP pyrophosphatase
VDGGYTNEIGVILINLSNEPFTIQPGDRIAQLVLAKIVQCEEFQNVEEFEAKERRGEDGYGSTGLQ